MLKTLAGLNKGMLQRRERAEERKEKMMEEVRRRINPFDVTGLRKVIAPHHRRLFRQLLEYLKPGLLRNLSVRNNNEVGLLRSEWMKEVMYVAAGSTEEAATIRDIFRKHFIGHPNLVRRKWSGALHMMLTKEERTNPLFSVLLVCIYYDIQLIIF